MIASQIFSKESLYFHIVNGNLTCIAQKSAKNNSFFNYYYAFVQHIKDQNHLAFVGQLTLITFFSYTFSSSFYLYPFSITPSSIVPVLLLKPDHLK